MGFNPKDIKYIINTHWHWDHTEATAALAELSGAKTLLGREDEENADVFIGNHVWNNDTFEKARILMETGENKFIDRDIWHQFLAFCEKRLDEVISKDNRD